MAKVDGNLRILILEDTPSDAKLVEYTLRKDGVRFESRVVDKKTDFIVALHEFKPHLILSDHSLIGFDSREALEIVQKEKVDVPFILVTGTVSEEYAVSVIKAGAADYILKSNLSRLTVAMLSALSQHQDRAKLKETEEQFQRTIDGMVDGVQIISYDWVYLYVNDIVVEQAKCRREDLLGHTMMERFPEIQHTGMFSELRRCMDERIHIEMENEFQFPDGSSGWFKLSIQPVAPGVLVVSRDITEQKNFIHLLESQNKRIKMVNAALDRFLYSVSHEFRTPICNGLGLINLLRDNRIPEERDDILDKLEFSIKNLDDLLQNIGVFSDITGSNAMHSMVDIRGVYTDCLSQLENLDGREDVQVNLKLNELVPFYSDRRRLSIVLSNLLSNGIKFRDPRKKSFVDVVVNVNQKAAHIEVHDNGLGIKEEYIDKIFDVFYAGEEQNKGRGLGLFMVREIIEKQGGTFSVNSQHDKGTVFYITLPNGSVKLN